MTGPPEPYVPGGKPTPPDGEPGEPWPPRIYVPGPPPGADDLAERVRRRLGGARGADLDPEGAEGHALAVLGDPALLEDVLEQLADELGERGADRVAALEPRGWLLGAPLAARTATPLLALREGPTRPDGRWTARFAGGGEEPADEEDRVFLVDAGIADGKALRAAIRRLEATGATVVGVAVLVEAGAGDGRQAMDGYNLMSIITL